MALASGEDEWEEWMASLFTDDGWTPDECTICGEPDCSGECWQHPPWYEEEEE